MSTGVEPCDRFAADCVVIAADHPESAASEVIEDAGFVVEPTVDTLAEPLDRALNGERPPQEPTDRASTYDCDNVTTRAEGIYQRAIVDQW